MLYAYGECWVGQVDGRYTLSYICLCSIFRSSTVIWGHSKGYQIYQWYGCKFVWWNCEDGWQRLVICIWHYNCQQSIVKETLRRWWAKILWECLAWIYLSFWGCCQSCVFTKITACGSPSIPGHISTIINPIYTSESKLYYCMMICGIIVIRIHIYPHPDICVPKLKSLMLRV